MEVQAKWLTATRKGEHEAMGTNMDLGPRGRAQEVQRKVGWNEQLRLRNT